MLSTGDGRTIDARRVLIAIGPWLTDGVGGSLAKALGVRTKKVAALHVLRRPAPDSPVFYFFDEDAFLLPAADRGEWILSFTSREWDCEPDISKLYIRPEERESALAILQRYCPSLAPDCLGGGRVFCDAYTKDWAPLIQDDPELPGCAIAGGCSGAGFRLAPAIGAEALRKITNSDTRLASACKEAALA
jgi:glycine/D-amino acid oxidase-like deaminating enzyme